MKKIGFLIIALFSIFEAHSAKNTTNIPLKLSNMGKLNWGG
ncbi:MAG: hypothetical protein ACI857_001024 [Arenicella sp.]|jgi:hypothetical protein